MGIDESIRKMRDLGITPSLSNGIETQPQRFARLAVEAQQWRTEYTVLVQDFLERMTVAGNPGVRRWKTDPETWPSRPFLERMRALRDRNIAGWPIAGGCVIAVDGRLFQRVHDSRLHGDSETHVHRYPSDPAAVYRSSGGHAEALGSASHALAHCLLAHGAQQRCR
jgi:hypothetical protein